MSEGGSRHPDRDAQFAYLNDQAAAHLAAGNPVISVDAKKKKENVGEFRNGGREWQPKGSPEQVNVHDFIDKCCRPRCLYILWQRLMPAFRRADDDGAWVVRVRDCWGFCW